MAVFSKTQEGANGRIQVLLRERNGFCFGAPEKTSKPGTSVLPRRLDAAIGAFLRFGKDRHRAALNFGDCMAYAVAAVAGLPLLYTGSDFAQTDIPAA